jgi:hypothetical protein
MTPRADIQVYDHDTFLYVSSVSFSYSFFWGLNKKYFYWERIHENNSIYNNLKKKKNQIPRIWMTSTRGTKSSEEGDWGRI